MSVIEAAGLVKRYGRFEALTGVSFEVGAGQVVGVVGANGAGKTTLLRILVDVLRPSRGRVRVFGTTPRQGSSATRRRIGYLPGSVTLPRAGRVGAYLDFAAGLSRTPASRFRALAGRLDLDPRARLATLSLGTRQKVGVVLALAHQPDLVVLDEPTTHLDPLAQRTVIDLLADARAEGRTVVLCSHMLAEVEELAERVIVLREGGIVLDGDVDDLRDALPSTATARFHGQPPLADLARLDPGVQVSGRTARLAVPDDVNVLIRALGAHSLSSLQIQRPDLSEVLAQLYEADQTSERGVTSVIGGA